MNIKIDNVLVHHLLESQFPEWKDLDINQILPGGWDNRCFRLGAEMVIRLPSAKRYADKVAKEQAWLPKLRNHLRLQIPTPLWYQKENVPSITKTEMSHFSILSR